jgi:hypothetical protein
MTKSTTYHAPTKLFHNTFFPAQQPTQTRTELTRTPLTFFEKKKKIPGYGCQLLFTPNMKEGKKNNTKTQTNLCDTISTPESLSLSH